MPALSNAQHEEFARMVAGGASKVDAYDRVFPQERRKAARDRGALLAGRAEVKERIGELLEEGAEEAIWSLAERLEYLRKVAMTSHAEVDENSPVCKGVKWTALGPEYKMPDKLAAVALYEKLTSEQAPAAGEERSLMGEMMDVIRAGEWERHLVEKKNSRVLENTRHERFAQLVGSGERAAYAYEKVYGVPRAAARGEGYELSHRPEVAARISEIRQVGGALVGWTRCLRLRYLRELAETPIGQINEASCFCQGVHRTRFGNDIKTPDRVRAVALYSKLAQEDQARRRRTIESIAAGMKARGDIVVAESTERSLISFVAGEG